jgi:hypothetical protein
VSANDRTVYTNCCEDFFSIFKRAIKGVYQHCKKEHLHRYLAEFDFRYNNRCSRPNTKKRPARKGFDDVQRTEILLRNVVCRRLTYQTTCPQMGRKKKPEPEDKEQYARFIETAERIAEEGADERFEDAMKRILCKKPIISDRSSTE